MSLLSDFLSSNPTGYCGFKSYPVAYQATEFPAYGREIRLTGNNQAFFFAKSVKDAENRIVDVEENTAALNTLIMNILAQGKTASGRPLVRLQIDADVFENPKRFVDKYQELVANPDPSKRKEFLEKETEIILEFVNNWGIFKSVKQALLANAKTRGDEMTSADIYYQAEVFLKHNFRLEGVSFEKPLTFATWEIANRDGVFVARQEYNKGAYQFDRPWQLGIEKQLLRLASDGLAGARQILNAVAYTRHLDAVDYSWGGALSSRRTLLKHSTQAKNPAPRLLHLVLP